MDGAVFDGSQLVLKSFVRGFLLRNIHQIVVDDRVFGVSYPLNRDLVDFADAFLHLLYLLAAVLAAVYFDVVHQLPHLPFNIAIALHYRFVIFVVLDLQPIDVWPFRSVGQPRGFRLAVFMFIHLFLIHFKIMFFLFFLVFDVFIGLYGFVNVDFIGGGRFPHHLIVGLPVIIIIPLIFDRAICLYLFRIPFLIVDNHQFDASLMLQLVIYSVIYIEVGLFMLFP